MTPLEKILYAGQSRRFFESHSTEFSKYNSKILSIILRSMTVISALYFIFDLNSGGSRAMRRTYLVFFLIFLVFDLLHDLWLRKSDLPYIYYLTANQTLFIFLLFVGPVLDSGNIACFIPVYFILAMLLYIMPLQYSFGSVLIDLVVFCVLTMKYKGAETGLIDIIDGCTCAAMGLVIGEPVLRGRLREAYAYEELEKRSNSELSRALKLANRDPLTSVKSRAAYESFEADLNARIENGDSLEFGLVFCDINGLKQRNDTEGHEAGDQLIKDSCAIICHTFLHSPVYRIGGDEFVVYLAGDDYLDRDALMAMISTHLCKTGGRVSFARGCAVFNPETDTCVNDVFIRADTAMYENKAEISAGAV